MLRPEQPVGKVNGTHFSPRTISPIDDNKGRNICGKAHCYPAKTGYGCPRPVRPRRTRCPIILICTCSRDAAADGGARSPTTWLARRACLDEIFLDVAEDEMEHYAENDAAYLAAISPGRNARRKLDVLVMKQPIGKPKWAYCKKPRKRRMSRSPPGKRFARRSIHHQAIQDELHAINKYQRYMNSAEEPRVKELLPSVNEEKEHVAEFTAALFRLTHEPLPEKPD